MIDRKMSEYELNENKIKIGQTTLFNYNYGSVLQCYSTQKVCQKIGCDCTLIIKKSNNRLLTRFAYLIRSLAKFIVYPKYSKQFLQLMKAQRKSAMTSMTESDYDGIQRFIETEIQYIAKNYSEIRKMAYSKEYSAFLSGSDQVWNAGWFLKEKMYYLCFAPETKRIAWAPSFGASEIAPYNKKRMAKDIGKYRFLSVREVSGRRLVKELTGREAKQIIDPVLQIDGEEWREYYKGKNDCSLNATYIFCYFLNEPCEEAVEYLECKAKAGYKIIAFASRYRCLEGIKNISYYGGSPWNFLYLIDHSDFVCSDSFHALAFSLLFHKHMLIFQRQYTHSNDQSERILSLLNQIGISDRFVWRNQAICCSKQEINFGYVDTYLDKSRRDAMQYLLTSVYQCAER